MFILIYKSKNKLDLSSNCIHFADNFRRINQKTMIFIVRWQLHVHYNLKFSLSYNHNNNNSCLSITQQLVPINKKN